MRFKSATDLTVLCHLLLLFLLGLSAYFEGAVSDAIYFGAFILPTLLGLLIAGLRGGRIPRIAMRRDNVRLLLPLVFPTVLLVMGMSVVSSLLLGFTGAENEVTVYPGFFENVIRHALLPAVLEEAAFRYLPMSLFGREQSRTCILVSSLSFALIHCNLLQIPYAFAAGVIFMGVNLIFGSPLPSLLLHMVNNLISVIIIYFDAPTVTVSVCAVIGVVSLAFIFLMRKDYAIEIKALFIRKSKYELSYSLLFLAVPTLFMAIINIG